MTFKRAYKTHKINIHTPKINRSKKGNIYLDSQKNKIKSHIQSPHTHTKRTTKKSYAQKIPKLYYVHTIRFRHTMLICSMCIRTDMIMMAERFWLSRNMLFNFIVVGWNCWFIVFTFLQNLLFYIFSLLVHMFINSNVQHIASHSLIPSICTHTHTLSVSLCLSFSLHSSYEVIFLN